MKRMLLGLVIVLGACENKELFLPCETENPDWVPVEIVIHWEGKPAANLPEHMRMHWHGEEHATTPISFDLNRYGGMERLPERNYMAFCYDYFANNMEFRGYNKPEQFEIYSRSNTDRLYNRFVPLLPNETTIAEADPPVFYMDSRPQTVNKQHVAPGDTIKLHFYPENLLREFTFMIYGVKGVENTSYISGAISGMSASYFPHEKRLADSASTLLFTRLETFQDGQDYPWTGEQKNLFAAKNPNWQSKAPTKGWTDDWITGRFSTFGPADSASVYFRLTINAVNKANTFVYGSWGHWFGIWEETVGRQIRASMEGNGNGTPEERRQWWRERNGGYDIILFNDGRLVIPEAEKPSGEKGDFDVNLDDWGNTHVPIG